MKRIIGYFSRLTSYLIPCNKRLLLFVSGFDYSDNPYAIYRYMIEHEKDFNYRFCWLVKDVERTMPLLLKDLKICNSNAKVRCVKRKSFLGIWYSYRARYIFNTTGLYRFIQYRQNDKRVNMWHGMPIKRIFSDVKNGDCTVATSDMFAPIMSKGLNIPIENVYIVGQPRNDLMFRRDLAQFEVLKKGYDSIGIWTPTFRRTTVDNYQDGCFNEGYISFVKFEQLEELNNILREKKSFLVIKLHPLDVLQNAQIPEYSNIAIYKNTNFHNKDLYPLLGVCDYMLSDYSSIAIDFELLQRPIGFTLDNFEEYGNTRGLSINKLPGKSLYSFNEMKEFILECIDKTIAIEDYGSTYNKYRDGNSSYRLLKELHLISN